MLLRLSAFNVECRTWIFNKGIKPRVMSELELFVTTNHIACLVKRCTVHTKQSQSPQRCD